VGIEIVFFSPPPPALFPSVLSRSPALLIRMSWSRLRDTQGFGLQCAAYIHHWIASHPGIMLHSTSLFPDNHLLARGHCPQSLGLCVSCPSALKYVEVPFVFTPTKIKRQKLDELTTYCHFKQGPILRPQFTTPAQ
jgi:hypothetical protein